MAEDDQSQTRGVWSVVGAGTTGGKEEVAGIDSDLITPLKATTQTRKLSMPAPLVSPHMGRSWQRTNTTRMSCLLDSRQPQPSKHLVVNINSLTSWGRHLSDSCLLLLLSSSLDRPTSSDLDFCGLSNVWQLDRLLSRSQCHDAQVSPGNYHHQKL